MSMIISENYLEKLEHCWLDDMPRYEEEPTFEDGMTLAEYKASLPIRFASEYPECKGVYE